MSHVSDHGQLMDDVYRVQRLFYDSTRKYYLLGRDHMIAQMQVQPGDSILELACGTGRNLDAIHRQHPYANLYGLDISDQMLRSARRKLRGRARLARADACAFDPAALFGEAQFEHIVFSYSLSMIPDWQRALDEAARHLAPGGTLHIVDFGDQAALPRWARRGLRAWLARFHVEPRDRLFETLGNMRGTAQTASLYRGYAYHATLTP